MGITDQGPMGVGGDGLIVKYSASGALQLYLPYDDGDGRTDMFTDVAVDRHGAIYAAGQHQTAAGTSDILLVKLTKAGAIPWGASIDGGIAGSDMAYDVVVDGSGDPRVIGVARVWGGVDELFVARYAAATGIESWRIAELGPAGSTLSVGTSGAVNSKSYLYVAVQVQNASGVWRSLMLKLKPNGVVSWSRAYKPGGTKSAFGQVVRLDPSGRPWILVQVEGAAGPDVMLVRCSAAGARTVVRRYGFSGGRRDFPADLAIDGAGRVFVAGKSTSPSTFAERGFVLSYTGTGRLRYARLYPKLTTRSTAFSAVLADGTGGAHAAGNMSKPGAWTNRLIVHYGATGRRAWAWRTVNAVGDDSFIALTRCGSAGIAAAGWVQVVSGNPDAIVEEYRR